MHPEEEAEPEDFALGSQLENTITLISLKKCKRITSFFSAMCLLKTASHDSCSLSIYIFILLLSTHLSTLDVSTNDVPVMLQTS